MPAKERGFSPQPAIVEKRAAPAPRIKPLEIPTPLQSLKVKQPENEIKRNAGLFAQSAKEKPEMHDRANHWESQARELQANGHTMEEIIVFFGQNMARSEAIAEKDPLTELYTRSGIERRFGEALAHSDRTKSDKSNKNKGKISIAVIDLDKFKAINDTYGHATGDKVLSSTAKFLQRDIRRTNTVGRQGGEEFVLIFPETDLPQAVEVLERKRTSFPEFVGPNSGIDKSITISAGVVTYDPKEYEKKFGKRNTQIKRILEKHVPVLDVLTPEERAYFLRKAEDERTRNILEYYTDKADRAMYAAKKRRNRVVAFVEDEFNDHLFVDTRRPAVLVADEKRINGRPTTIYSAHETNS